MAAGKSQGKGKCMGPPPPPSQSKGNCKGKGKAPTINSITLHHPRMTALRSDGKVIQGISMSGEVLFYFAAEDVLTARALKREIEKAILRGEAANVRVSLYNSGNALHDEDLVRDVSSVVVKWSRGWKTVATIEKGHGADEHGNTWEEAGGIALPVETEIESFEDCRLTILQHECAKFESNGFVGEKPEIVAGFRVPRGKVVTSWPKVDTYADNIWNEAGGESLPIETDIPGFQELRRRLIDFQRQRYLELGNDAPAVRVIAAAGPKTDLDIPPHKSVDILETLSTHVQPFGIVPAFPVAAFGFCLDIDLHGSDLCILLEYIRAGDSESLAQHATAGSAFEAEATRLDVSLKDVLPCLQVRALDAGGRFLYSLYPKQDVHPAEIIARLPMTFTVGIQGLPVGCFRKVHSTADLCAVTINPASSVESSRLALEVLTTQSASQESRLSAGSRKGLVTIGCLLSTHTDAAVREQAQALLNASMSVDSLSFVRQFFNRHQHDLGRRVLQEASTFLTDCEDADQFRKDRKRARDDA